MTSFPINEVQTLDYLRAMVALDSVNPGLVAGAAGEGAMAAWLAQTCSELGLTVSLQEVAPGRPNLIARWPGQGAGKSLLLTGHTDVVGIEGMSIAPFQPREEGGRLYGRGSFDMKGGLAAILGAVAALKAAGFQPGGNLILGFVVDEEYLSIGTEALVQAVQADAAILTEPTQLQIGLAHRGFAWLTLETGGHAAHGSDFRSGVDAIAQMRHLLNALHHLESELLPRREHPLLGRASVHASLINGGLGLSTYPDHCRLQVEHRLLPDEGAELPLDYWQGVLAQQGAADPQFRGSVRLDFMRPGYEIDAQAPIVQALVAASGAVLPQAAPLAGVFGWLDSALLGAAGIPTVIFGPGGAGAHAAVEYVNIAEVMQAAAVLAATCARWLGQG